MAAMPWPRSAWPGCTSTISDTPATTWRRGAPGASLREIKKRMGDDSPRAALTYQHADREADRGIAEAIDRAGEATRRKPGKRT